MGQQRRETIKKVLSRRAATAWKTRHDMVQRPHGLPSRLIINLTSFPPRYATLRLTLQCLLTQTIKPDSVVLWLAEADRASLPENIRQMKKAGLKIRSCEDFRSYNKIVHAVREFPKSFLAIADDDVYYPPDWLEGLIAAYDPLRWDVPCYRAHRITKDSAGRIQPYLNWDQMIPEEDCSPLVFPTAGVGGALYRPGILHADVLRGDIFTSLAPTTDDIWLYFMMRRNGAVARKITGHSRFVTWQGSQTVNLMSINNSGGGNDRAFDALCQFYGGDPTALPVTPVPEKPRPKPKTNRQSKPVSLRRKGNLPVRVLRALRSRLKGLFFNRDKAQRPPEPKDAAASQPSQIPKAPR